MTLNKRFSNSISTAGVSPNGLNFQLDINYNFWYSLSEDHRYGTIKHEVLHLCFFHIFMRNSFKDWSLFNIAADIEINQYIDSRYLPKMALLPSSFPELQLKLRMGTKYYYDMLENNLNSDNPSKSVIEVYKIGDILHPDWEKCIDDQNISEDGFTKSQKELMKTQLEHQLKECAENIKDRGLIPKELEKLIDSLLEIKKQIFNWKAYFRRFLGSSFNIYTKKSYRAPSHRFEESAGLKIKKKHHILVAIDTSGSVNDRELMEFFSEIYHIWKVGCSVEIIECDARIQRKYLYNGKFDGKCSGRGGTIFDPVIEYYNQNFNKYTTLIYFTDGYGENDIRKPFKRMMWVVTSSGRDDREYYPGYMIQIPK
jgi:predicted metal-dependent peptidase